MQTMKQYNNVVQLYLLVKRWKFILILLPVMLVPKTADVVLHYLCLYRYVLVSINRVTHVCFHVASQSIIRAHYVITLCSAFGQTIEDGYSSSLLLYELLVTHITGRWSSKAVDDVINWRMELKENDGIYGGLQVSSHNHVMAISFVPGLFMNLKLALSLFLNSSRLYSYVWFYTSGALAGSLWRIGSL